MASNHVTLIGNLVEDPELKFTNSGISLCRLRFAVNRRYQKDGEWQEETSFFTGVLWRDQAEHAAESLSKGSRVIITGRIEQRSWENQDGEKRSTIEVAIDEIGPSLRWATAEVHRTQSGGFSGNDALTPAAAPVARQSYGDDEAPF